jgi:SpoVK/Ycf46/Vps4 family AAA+-type ATPase
MSTAARGFFRGVSEKVIANVFALADEMCPSTVFLDELDVFVSHEPGRRVKALVVAKLEGMADDNSVFVVPAANMPWELDKALCDGFINGFTCRCLEGMGGGRFWRAISSI